MPHPALMGAAGAAAKVGLKKLIKHLGKKSAKKSAKKAAKKGARKTVKSEAKDTVKNPRPKVTRKGTGSITHEMPGNASKDFPELLKATRRLKPGDLPQLRTGVKPDFKAAQQRRIAERLGTKDRLKGKAKRSAQSGY